MPEQLEGTWPHYGEDEVEAVTRVLHSGKVNYWTGEQGRLFEQEYAGHCGVQFGIALANGSLALDLALEAAGIGPGDDVIVTPRSFVASTGCVVRVGARPVFADVCRESQNITAETIEAALTTATKAIIPVHLAGWPCDMGPIVELASQKDLMVIEDCAQAHGAEYRGRPVGGIGHIGAFSFCQDKIITTGGEGGLLVTNSKEIWQKAWAIKDHGKSHDIVFAKDHPPGFRWLHTSFGTNMRMTEMQAAIGRLQLSKLPDWTRRRSEIALRLAEVLRMFPSVRVPVPSSDVTHGYYRLYAFVEDEHLASGWSRDRIMQTISDQGVPCFSGSCPELYNEKAFDLGIRPSTPLPIAHELGETSLAFLVHPTLTTADVERSCEAIREVFERATRTIAE